MKAGKLALATILLVMVGCSGGGDGGPRPAELEITFVPNPVTRSADGYWYYHVTVTEKNNTGVVVNYLCIDDYAPNGEFLDQDCYNPSTFADWFDRCGGVDNYIAGGTQRCAYMRSWGISGWRDWTITGIDDLGNDISATGRLTVQ